MPKENTDTQTTSETAKASIRGAIKKAIDWLKVRQAPDGMWNAPLETNCCMEAQWILAMHFIDFDDPKKPKVLQYILDRQREDGAWDVYYGSEHGDINTTLDATSPCASAGSTPTTRCSPRRANG